MNHKRGRTKRQRAGCTCGPKENKHNGRTALRGGAPRSGSASELRLRDRAAEAE